MLYKYFVGTGETEIESVEQVFELYKKGMISKTSKLYDVEKNIYVEAYAVPEFIEVFMEEYTGESKSSRLSKYIISTIFFLVFLLEMMINTFLSLGLEEIETNTTNFLLYMIGTFFGMTILIALLIFIFKKFFKRYSSILIISSSILMCIVSTVLLVNNVMATNVVKEKRKLVEKAALVKIVEIYESGLLNTIVQVDINADDYGKFVPLVLETQNYVLNLEHMNSEVDYLFKNMPLSQIIAPEGLADVQRIKQNRESIEVIISGLTESKENNNALDNYISKIENLAIPESVRKEFISAAKKNSEEEKREKDELYDLNIKLFEKIDEMFKYFEDRPGRYSVVNNMVIFNEKSDEDNYNKLTQEYGILLEQYNEAAKISVENDESNLTFLKDLVGKNHQ